MKHPKRLRLALFAAFVAAGTVHLNSIAHGAGARLALVVGAEYAAPQPVSATELRRQLQGLQASPARFYFSGSRGPDAAAGWANVDICVEFTCAPKDRVPVWLEASGSVQLLIRGQKASFAEVFLQPQQPGAAPRLLWRGALATDQVLATGPWPCPGPWVRGSCKLNCMPPAARTSERIRGSSGWNERLPGTLRLAAIPDPPKVAALLAKRAKNSTRPNQAHSAAMLVDMAVAGATGNTPDAVNAATSDSAGTLAWDGTT